MKTEIFEAHGLEWYRGAEVLCRALNKLFWKKPLNCGESITEQASYWIGELSDMPPGRELPAIKWEGEEFKPAYSLPSNHGWQPIETAPKDGTQILLFGSGDHPWVTVGEWMKDFDTHWDDQVGKYVDEPAWIDLTVASWNYEECAKLTPTHWQPLPLPPETSN